MKHHQTILSVLVVTLALTLGLLISGCGEKIAIPQAKGVFSLDEYTVNETYEVDGPAIQLTRGGSFLFVLTPGTLSKYETDFDLQYQVTGLAGPLALCVDGEADFVFVWEDDTKSVVWYDTIDGQRLGSSSHPEVQTVTGMATNPSGIQQVPGARTFLYLSDPLSGVIHRYAFSLADGLDAYGVLARADGAGARFVHDPAGMATDSEDSLLVCDVATNRNWVIRFSSIPDLLDTDLRGFAVLFDPPEACTPASASEFVLGNAAECNEEDWVGGPSVEVGEFDRPSDVAIDGSGRIFVADTSNRRIQLFSSTGEYLMQSTGDDETLAPTSLGVFDKAGNTGEAFFGAFVFVTLENSNSVVRLISGEYYQETVGDDGGPY